MPVRVTARVRVTAQGDSRTVERERCVDSQELQVWLRKHLHLTASVSALEQSWLGLQCGPRSHAEQRLSFCNQTSPLTCVPHHVARRFHLVDFDVP